MSAGAEPLSDPRALDDELLAAARRLVAQGLVIGSTGNVSARAGELVRVTPTRIPYEDLWPGDLVTTDLDGRIVERGAAPPSCELALHLEIYRTRPDIGAIVHTHSTHAVAWSFLGRPLEPVVEDIEYYDIGSIATSPRAAPGSAALARAGAQALGTSRAALLGGHGAIAVGATPKDAVTIAAVVEHQAQVAWLLR